MLNNSAHYLVSTFVLLFLVAEPFVTPRTVVCQAPLSMGFPRQEYWSGVPFPPPGGLPSPGPEPSSLVCAALAGRFSTTEPSGKPFNSSGKEGRKGRRRKEEKERKKKINERDFPGSLGVKTPHFQCRDCGFNPWSGTKIPRATRYSHKKCLVIN